MPTTEYTVEFLSPGTFVAESSSRPLEKIDVHAALALYETIEERYAARPYAFRFVTKTLPDPCPYHPTHHRDEITVEYSGVFHINAELLSVEDVIAENNPRNSILIANMTGNRIPYVARTSNSYIHHAEFYPDKDVVVFTLSHLTRK